MQTTYRIIQADGTEQSVTIDLPKEPGYEALRAIVEPVLGGAYMERVRVLHKDAYTDMFVDEDGLLKGLPLNAVATPIYHANWLKQRPGTHPSELTPIVGTAVLFDRPVWF